VLPPAADSIPGASASSPRAGSSSSASGGSIFEGGLFDRGSWTEAQAGWARSVVTGRARLGGIPVGVVAVESQTVHKAVPADPGMPDSSEVTIPQAGQVGGGCGGVCEADCASGWLPLLVLAAASAWCSWQGSPCRRQGERKC
jgi:hypothetical protein